MKALLTGPRGRRLLLELAVRLSDAVREALFDLAYAHNPGRDTSCVLVTWGDVEPRKAASIEELTALLRALPEDPLSPDLVHEALGASVDSAMYWQEPDGEDVVARMPSVQEALAPLAERVSTIAWTAPAPSVQHLLEWEPPIPAARTDLAAWVRSTRDAEQQARRERPQDPAAAWSGSWWSIPLDQPVTYDEVPRALDLIEDELGWEKCTTTPVQGPTEVLEITGAEDWAKLCREHPLEVTASRRHDWYRVTGRDGTWVIPDWEAVSRRWGAVHLTVPGYLTAATTLIDVADGVASVIAGWNPGSTLWLREAPGKPIGPSQHWRWRDDDDGAGRWHPVDP
ncbi:hypothetical protein [Brachybacterium sp. UMB0905]|uniref:hypothetical protein n=1 Tax=Brachybacterium sp. UMB0905 TaxID=2069310 RepID=UPI0011AF49D2|nr:hypothetical protein [Brachybacterium sp. UMB0905]